MTLAAARTTLSIALVVSVAAGCSVGGNDPNPAYKDSDGDGLSDRVETAHGLDPTNPGDAALDRDLDGLSNAAEIDTYGTDLDRADTDSDGLNDGDEVLVHGTNALRLDTDDDALGDGAEVTTHGTDPRAADTDGDTLEDGTEASGFVIHDGTTRASTDPLDVDTDADGIHDGLEKAVQDAFAAYASTANATAFLTGALHPNNPTSKPSLGGLSFVDPGLGTAALEADPDGDGKPTLEELFHQTNPNDGASEFTYIYEQDTAGTLKARFQAMAAAHFVFVPGGWDVNGDGSVEAGFFLAAYEAKSASVPNNDTSQLPALLAGSLVYNRSAQKFVDRLCDNTAGGNGTDSDTTDDVGACRGNKYLLAGTSLATAGTVSAVTFTPSGAPYTGLTWLEARLALRASPIDAAAAFGGPYAIALPTETQALQVVRLAINHPENWTGSQPGAGALYQGHTDNAPSGALAVVDPGNPYDQTGNGAHAGASQRRTLVLANGIMARDFTLPLNHRVEVWDFAGNAAEWSAGLVAANHNTSSPSGRAGGDRFAGGLAELESYTGLNLSGPAGDITAMPAWLKPLLRSGTVLAASSGVGAYYDGFSGSDVDGDGKSDGGYTQMGYGYAADSHGDGFVGAVRGGHFAAGSSGGIASLDLQHGLGRRVQWIGFRAASAAQ